MMMRHELGLTLIVSLRQGDWQDDFSPKQEDYKPPRQRTRCLN